MRLATALLATTLVFGCGGELEQPPTRTISKKGGGGGSGSTETKCTDGRDNDRDGATDCADTDCAADSSCQVTPPPPPPPPTGEPEQCEYYGGWNQYTAKCEDGVDNDGDGLTDCADPGCQTSCLYVCQ
jgi:hypothetical protein